MSVAEDKIVAGIIKEERDHVMRLALGRIFRLGYQCNRCADAAERGGS